MKLRSIALLGLGLAALSVSPALANDTQGWYLGLGVGYDHMEPVHVVTAPPLSAHANLGQSDMAMVAGSFGYKWASGLRLEFEAGYSTHDQHGVNPPFAGTLSGSTQIKSALVNIVYDMNLGGNWGLSLGGGVGAGAMNMSITDSFFPALKLIRGQHTEFMWQGIVGLNYQTSDNVEWFIDYRYRSAEQDHGFASDFVALNPIHVAQGEEHVAMLGLRWFMCGDFPGGVRCGPEEEVVHVDPPKGCPEDPSKCPPPPVRTFIVFFDFAKANIDEKAAAIVAEAVRHAKMDGYVKVQIVGHTDTVGGDAYNMDLSTRRATAVKEQMILDGLDRDTIAIDGRGFHDPLVKTGPGVREPQNRRATIDLGPWPVK